MDLCVIDSAPTNCLCVPQERVSLMNLWRCQAYLRSSAITWLKVSSGESRKGFCYNCCGVEPHTMSRHTTCSQQWHASSQSAILHDSIWPVHFPDMLANFSGTFIPGKSVGLPFMHFFLFNALYQKFQRLNFHPLNELWRDERNLTHRDSWPSPSIHEVNLRNYRNVTLNILRLDQYC